MQPLGCPLRYFSIPLSHATTLLFFCSIPQLQGSFSRPDYLAIGRKTVPMISWLMQFISEIHDFYPVLTSLIVDFYIILTPYTHSRTFFVRYFTGKFREKFHYFCYINEKSFFFETIHLLSFSLFLPFSVLNCAFFFFFVKYDLKFRNFCIQIFQGFFVNRGFLVK